MMNLEISYSRHRVYGRPCPYIPAYRNVRGTFRRIGEIAASILFFVVLIGGLNVLAILL